MHRRNWPLAQPSGRAAWRLLQRVREAGGFPLSLSLVNSRVTAVMTSEGQNLLPQLLSWVDVKNRDLVAELAFATSGVSLPVDWSVNSAVNEASGGMHVALGAGVEGAHIDFISTEAVLSWCEQDGSTQKIWL